LIKEKEHGVRGYDEDEGEEFKVEDGEFKTKDG